MKPFTIVTIGFLTLIVFVHALRILLGWNVTVDGFGIPMWVSMVAFVAITGLAVGLWRETRV